VRAAPPARAHPPRGRRRSAAPVSQAPIQELHRIPGVSTLTPCRSAGGRSRLSQAHSPVVAEPIDGDGFWGAYTGAMIPGSSTVEAGEASTPSTVAWFRDKFGAAACRRGQEALASIPYGILTEMARNIPIGCDGAVAPDCFHGNRSPYTGPPARTIFWGLSMNHGPGHVFRPIIERICYGTELILPTVQEHAFNPRVNVVPAAQLRAACGYRFTPTFRTFRSPLGRCPRAPVLGAAIGAYRGRRDVPQISPRPSRGWSGPSARSSRARAPPGVPVLRRSHIESYEQFKDVMHTTVCHVNEKRDAACVAAPAPESRKETRP
jgi:hypothetical protein